MLILYSKLGYLREEFQILRLMVVVVFGALD